MIVGDGFMARAFAPKFNDDPDTVIFASGVSNSLETSAASFERERSLLKKMLARGAERFVYFGSCGVSIEDAEPTQYMEHKKSMESTVLSSPGAVILRLPQVVGVAKNSHTLTNFLRDRIQSGEHFSVWSGAERNLIDIDDVVAIGTALIANASVGPQAFSIAARQSFPMPEIVKIFERVLGRAANYSLECRGCPLKIDARLAIETGERLGIDLGAGYIERVVAKYYAPPHKTDLNG
jgi:nucleoside-diphosphate-sugar epimerase